MFSDSDLPPLETEIGDLNSEKEGNGEVNSFYKKIKAKLELGDMDDKENNEYLKTFIKSDLEDMNKHFMQGFELLASQLGSK